MAIKCGNCDAELDECYSCRAKFAEASTVICQDYGDEHFCSEECFYARHDAFIETAYESGE